jgi:hypothetical protein
VAEKSNARLFCGECESEHYFTRADGRMECTDCGRCSIVLEVFAPFFPQPTRIETAETAPEFYAPEITS